MKPWHRFGYDVDVHEDDLQRIVQIAESHPNRRIRGEAILTLHMVSTFGSGEADEVARTTLEGLAESDDPMISGSPAGPCPGISRRRSQCIKKKTPGVSTGRFH